MLWLSFVSFCSSNTWHIQLLKLMFSSPIHSRFLHKTKQFHLKYLFFFCFSQQEMKKRQFKTFKEEVKSHFPVMEASLYQIVIHTVTKSKDTAKMTECLISFQVSVYRSMQLCVTVSLSTISLSLSAHVPLRVSQYVCLSVSISLNYSTAQM